jgi:hypothetical protein
LPRSLRDAILLPLLYFQAPDLLILFSEAICQQIISPTGTCPASFPTSALFNLPLVALPSIPLHAPHHVYWQWRLTCSGLWIQRPDFYRDNQSLWAKVGQMQISLERKREVEVTVKPRERSVSGNLRAPVVINLTPRIPHTPSSVSVASRVSFALLCIYTALRQNNLPT